MTSSHDTSHANAEPVTFGVLTVSDTCSLDPTNDQSGPTAVRLIEKAGHRVAFQQCVSDDQVVIETTLHKWIGSGLVDVIISSGGTGLTERDVTYDTVLKLIEPQHRLPGLEHALYSTSLQHTPMAAICRFIAGVWEKVLLVTLPGSPKAVCQCVPILLSTASHAVQLIKGYPKPISSINHSKPPAVTNRPRTSPYPMVSVAEAQFKMFQIAEQIRTRQTLEAVDYRNALGRVLGLTLKSQQSIPPFDASQMDGYAVRFNNTPGSLKVIGSLCAGDECLQDIRVHEGTCVRVNTGGPIPLGADTIVPVERTMIATQRSIPNATDSLDSATNEEDVINVLSQSKVVGEFIRPMGSDSRIGDEFKLGLRLGPQEIGILCANGLLSPWPVDVSKIVENIQHLPVSMHDRLLKGGYIPCLKQPRIGIMSTGNEVLDGSRNLPGPSVIFDSNRPLIATILRKYGYNNVVDFGIACDQVDLLAQTFDRAFHQCDILITTGGVSMGEKDFVANVLADQFNAQMHFSRVFMKPGKPTKLATVSRPQIGGALGQPVVIFCLPGNPATVHVTMHLFVLPLLRNLELRPASEWQFPRLKVRLMQQVKLGDRPDYRRARLVWEHSSNDTVSVPCASVEQLAGQQSSRLASCLDADLLLCLPEESKMQKEMTVGSVVDAHWIGT